MKGERTLKRASFSNAMRRALSDITNSPLQVKDASKDGKQLQFSPATKNYVEQLLEEKMALVKVIEERNKTIELSGAELQKLRINYQKIQLQNWNLAQSNSQLLAEVQSAREKIRVLQHELICKDAVIKAKNSERQGKEERNGQKIGSKLKEGENEASQSLDKPDDRAKPCNREKRHCHKSRSMAPPSTSRQDADREKEGSFENKRRCIRRHSARFKSDKPEPPENLFEIEDARFPINKLADNSKQGAAPTILPSSSTNKEEKYDNRTSGIEINPSRKSAFGRPSRRAAEMVQSYRERPLNTKMRRTE